MSNRQNEIRVSLFSTLAVLAYALVKTFQMLLGGGLDQAEVFRLWAVVIGATIILNIAGNILTNIVINIVHAIKTRREEEVRMLVDERDKLIGLKGDRAAYIAFAIGVFLSMLTFALGQPPLVMFSLIVLTCLLAEIVGDVSQLIIYHKGA